MKTFLALLILAFLVWAFFLQPPSEPPDPDSSGCLSGLGNH